MKTNTRAWMRAVTVIALVTLCSCAAKAPPRTEQVRVTISGMHCEGCAEGISDLLRHCPGVMATDVHFSNAVQTIDYDANRLGPDEIRAAISNEGYAVAFAPGTQNSK